jgi:hypothetical protein
VSPSVWVAVAVTNLPASPLGNDAVNRPFLSAVAVPRNPCPPPWPDGQERR